MCERGLRPYHARIREEIERFGGTVEKFIGDAVMAVFGAPVAHEDDAERAVRAGLRMLEAVDELNAADPAWGCRCGSASTPGRRWSRSAPGRSSVKGIVAGDVVNTAARLQGAAPVDGVAVSEQTYRETERVFEYERLEPVTVKGKSEPLADLPAAAGSGASSARDVTRAHDDAAGRAGAGAVAAHGTFERAAQQRSCQLVTLVGEPGVGKSRLCRGASASGGATRSWSAGGRAGACPYGDGHRVLGAGRDRQGASAGSSSRTRPRRRRTKLERRRSPTDDPERGWLLARLAPLVGAPAEPAGQRGVVRGVAALLREPRRRADDRAGVRGPALGGPDACSRSSSTWPTGPRACRCCSCAPPGPSCTSGIRPSARTPATRSGSTSPA